MEDRHQFIFIGSPRVSSLEQMEKYNVHMSDISLHDATRELVLLSEKFEDEYKLTQNLEVLTDKLQQSHRQLDEEKKKTDR